jgi:hypothetical protein
MRNLSNVSRPAVDAGDVNTMNDQSGARARTKSLIDLNDPEEHHQAFIMNGSIAAKTNAAVVKKRPPPPPPLRKKVSTER